jgi:integration host factor subunit alpha
LPKTIYCELNRTRESGSLIYSNAFAAGEDVSISGFGKVCVKEKRHRMGSNPASGEDMMLDAIVCA